MTHTWRNKSHHKGEFCGSIIQVQEDVFESGAECLALWTIPKDEGYGRTSDHIHGRRCWKSWPSSWRCHRYYFAHCWLYDQKGVGGQWKLNRHSILPCLLANETWTRPTSSNKLSFGRFQWNEGAACRHHYSTRCSRGIPTTSSQRREFLGDRLLILL